MPVKTDLNRGLKHIDMAHALLVKATYHNVALAGINTGNQAVIYGGDFRISRIPIN